MPVFEITSPDGKTFEVTAPAGATQDEVLAYAQSQFQQKQSFSPTQTIKNIPGSAVEYGKNIASAVMHPIQTVSGIFDVGAGELRKVLPTSVVKAIDKLEADPAAIQKYQQSADVVNQFYKQRYGSGEQALQTIQKDPVGFLGDVSALFTGGGMAIPKVGSKVAKVGAAVEPLNVATNVAGAGLAKSIPSTVPASLYESAAKWSTSLTPEERASITGTALKENLMPTYAGTGKAQMTLSMLGDKIDNLIQTSTQSGAKIPANEVLRNIGDVRNELGGFKIESPSDIKEINAIEKQFRDMVRKGKKQYVTPEELQSFKQDVYKRVDYGRAPEKPTVAKEAAYKAMGRAAKESIESVVPSVAELNKRQGALIELLPNLQRSAARIENRDILGIGGPIKIGSGSALGGDVGAIAGAGQSIFEMPKVKAKTALELYRRQQAPLQAFYANNPITALMRQLLQQQGGLQQQGLLTNE